MREVERDAVLRRRHDLPDAVLVGRIQLRERRAVDRAVSRVDVASARVCRSTTRWQCQLKAAFISYISRSENCPSVRR